MAVSCARSAYLRQLMEDEGFLPSPEVEKKRKNAMVKLNEIVIEWAKSVAERCQLPREHIKIASASISPCGSFCLGVHDDESETDVLCIGPCFASMAEDFFVDLRDMLAIPEISEISSIKSARLPLLRFKFEGISVNLYYGKIRTAFVPRVWYNPFYLENIDEVSSRSLSGAFLVQAILRVVPNFKAYQSLLRAVRFWAKRRGIYGKDVGFFGGVHLAVLAAFVCGRHPRCSLSVSVLIFFKTFAFWPWPKPVILTDGVANLQPNDDLITRYKMPIQVPSITQNEYSYCGTTRSTFTRIVKEFRKAYDKTLRLCGPVFEWEDIFKPFSYAKEFEFFLKICLSSTNQEELNEWVCHVKSRFSHLISILEEDVDICYPDPRENTDIQLLKPNVVFHWGLISGGDDFSPGSIKEAFMTNILSEYDGPVGGMDLFKVERSGLTMVEESASESECSVLEMQIFI